MDYRFLIILLILVLLGGGCGLLLYYKANSYKNFLKDFDNLEINFLQLKDEVEGLVVSDKFRYINIINDSLSLIQTYRKMNLSTKELKTKYLDLMDNYNTVKKNIK